MLSGFSLYSNINLNVWRPLYFCNHCALSKGSFLLRSTITYNSCRIKSSWEWKTVSLVESHMTTSSIMSALLVKLVPSWSNPIQSLSYVCSASWKTLCSCISSGCAKTYVRWSRMGRNLVQTCKPGTGTIENNIDFKLQ